MNLFANNLMTDSVAHHSSNGGVINNKDSVLIAYDDLRIVNSKLIQLKYEQEINSNLRNVVHNDSIVIDKYKTINNTINKDYKKAIRQRNIAIGTGALLFIVFILLLFK